MVFCDVPNWGLERSLGQQWDDGCFGGLGDRRLVDLLGSCGNNLSEQLRWIREAKSRGMYGSKYKGLGA